MTIDQRIKYLIALTCEGNQRVFAKNIGAKPQTISNLLSRKSAPGFKLVQQIMRKYPTLNPYWLILGEGTVGEDFQAEYIDAKEYYPVLQESQTSYLKSEDQADKFKQRIASLEREVELLEQIIKEKELLIGHLRG